MNEVCALERVQRSVERRSGIARHARRRVKIYLANNLLLLARTVRGKSFSTFATLSQSFSRSNSTELRIEIEISFYRLWLSNSFEIQALFASSYVISNTIPITSYIYIIYLSCNYFTARKKSKQSIKADYLFTTGL